MSGAQGTGRLAACAAGLRQPNLRPVLLSSLVHALTENAIWMGVLVYAFQSGGAGEMGVVSFALLMPAWQGALPLSASRVPRSRSR